MRIILLLTTLLTLAACGIEDSNWHGESGHDGGWYDESGKGGWHDESGDSWYGKNVKETGDECNVYGRCGGGGGGGGDE